MSRTINGKKAKIRQRWQETSFTTSVNVEPSIVVSLVKQFDPEAALHHIVANSELSTPERYILFRGFCTWIIAPKRAALIRRAMLLTLSTIVATTERAYREKYGNVLGDVLVRAEPDTQWLYTRMLYPLGGVSAFLDAWPRYALRKALTEERPLVELVNGMVKVFHYHVKKLSDDRKSFGIPSLNKAAPILKDILGEATKGRMNIAKWGQRRDAAAFSYAASAIVAGKPIFLDQLLSGKLGQEEMDGPFLELVSKARFVAEEIFSKLDKKTGSFALQKFPPGVKARELPCPELSEEKQQLIADTFRIKRGDKSAARTAAISTNLEQNKPA
jgi:hypothetical protein